MSDDREDDVDAPPTMTAIRRVRRISNMTGSATSSTTVPTITGHSCHPAAN